MDGFNHLIKKKVYIETLDNRKYSGIINKVFKNDFLLIDKFDKEVYLLKSNIKLIQEEN